MLLGSAEKVMEIRGIISKKKKTQTNFLLLIFFTILKLQDKTENYIGIEFNHIYMFNTSHTCKPRPSVLFYAAGVIIHLL